MLVISSAPTVKAQRLRVDETDAAPLQPQANGRPDHASDIGGQER